MLRTMTESLEALAEEGAATAVTSRLEQAARNVAKLVRCWQCAGHGQDPSRFGFLWGGACWVCSGWGSLIEGTYKLRGPLAPHPSR